MFVVDDASLKNMEAAFLIEFFQFGCESDLDALNAIFSEVFSCALHKRLAKAASLHFGIDQKIQQKGVGYAIANDIEKPDEFAFMGY